MQTLFFFSKAFRLPREERPSSPPDGFEYSSYTMLPGSDESLQPFCSCDCGTRVIRSCNSWGRYGRKLPQPFIEGKIKIFTVNFVFKWKKKKGQRLAAISFHFRFLVFVPITPPRPRVNGIHESSDILFPFSVGPDGGLDSVRPFHLAFSFFFFFIKKDLFPCFSFAKKKEKENEIHFHVRWKPI